MFTGDASGSCLIIPAQTGGPYPGDGSITVSGSTVNALALSGIVRSDIRSGLPASLGTAAGVPLTVTLPLVDTNASCAGLAGDALCLRQCDRDGNCSM
jgi:protocatechuate 3,4-dioxygenase beta subunit